MCSDVVHDGFNQLRDALEGAPADALVCQVAEPAFVYVDPGTICGDAVHVKPTMTLEPFLDLGVLMRGVVIRDQALVHAIVPRCGYRSPEPQRCLGQDDRLGATRMALTSCGEHTRRRL